MNIRLDVVEDAHSGVVVVVKIGSFEILDESLKVFNFLWLAASTSIRTTGLSLCRAALYDVIVVTNNIKS